MDRSADNPWYVPPRVVATGFTTAFLGDERLLREFIVGDHVCNQLNERGEHAVLYLINDSYDPLRERQLRLGVNKDEGLIRKFEKYCGWPISEVPDPYGCHSSYSEHFTAALVHRLHTLGIHPVVVDSYRAYKLGYYANYIMLTFENYWQIQETLATNLQGYSMKNLFRPACTNCRCIDATNIREVAGKDVRFSCDRCGTESCAPVDEIQGKLSWKLDCAARWNIYGIDLETFAQSHVGGLGTFEVSELLSRSFYGGRIPGIVKYGDVQITREMSGQVLELLPPQLFRKLFTSHLNRDLRITKDMVETFCQKSEVRPGMSYVNYVRQELPHSVLRAVSKNESPDDGQIPSNSFIPESSLIEYGKRFSRFFYQKDHEVRLPDPHALSYADQATMDTASRLIRYVLSTRIGGCHDSESAKATIKTYLRSQNAPPEVYRFLRRVFHQSQGPNIASILAVLPLEYLDMVHLFLSSTSTKRPPERHGDPKTGSPPSKQRGARVVDGIATFDEEDSSKAPPAPKPVVRKKSNLDSRQKPSSVRGDP